MNPDPSSVPVAGPPPIPDHELQRCIGAGSYGEVWLARNILGAHRAVKIVHRRNFDHDRPYEREFAGIRKYEPVSRTHESQVAILHVGRDDARGCFYYIMELADPEPDAAGHVAEDPADYQPRTLKSEVRRRGRLPVADCVAIGLDLADALVVLHDSGLVHRDIKPANIIFIRGRPRLADIGLVTDADQSRARTGTEGFIPPEGSGTPGGDVFALGRVLYEISTGRDRMDYPELPVDFDRWTSRSEWLELDAIVQRACDPDPRRRYASAAALRGDLARLQQGESIKGRRRRSLAIRWFGAGLLAAGFLAAGFWWIRHRPVTPRAAATQPAGAAIGSSHAEAANLYQLGRFYLEQRTVVAISNAIGRFDEAIALDPGFARAHAQLAISYHLLVNYNGMPTAIGRPRAREAALRALALDETVADAHLALAYYQRDYGWDLAAAEREFLRAIQLEPFNATAHQWYSSLLSRQRRHAAAIRAARRAIELQPTSLVINANLGARLVMARDYPAAIAQYRHAIAMNQSFALSHRELATVLELAGRHAEAVAELLQVDQLSGVSAQIISGKDAAFERGGWLGFWRHVRDLDRAQPTLPALARAAIEMRLGNLEPMLDELERALLERRGDLLESEVHPSYDPLRQHPRYLDLLRRGREAARQGPPP